MLDVLYNTCSFEIRLKSEYWTPQIRLSERARIASSQDNQFWQSQVKSSLYKNLLVMYALKFGCSLHV